MAMIYSMPNMDVAATFFSLEMNDLSDTIFFIKNLKAFSYL